ncbi:hypothetical protein Poly51_59600 [Rubripirellula tenax]|uniref:Uncharacterized protein n=1 Tax=Rubripirellula tenax TaxID=2528015 RepID=A0A5C6EAA1_9BACT|nr:hypothetical protein Poly51_59600 [Rubripirellula tenax]
MGRCPEDGQTVAFETSTDRAFDLFCELTTNTWVCRLAVIHHNVHAIYTPEISPDFKQIAADVSRIFDYAVYELVCDEPIFQVWKNGNIWIPEIPEGPITRKHIEQLKGMVFVESSSTANGRLWDLIHEFAWANFGSEEFLFEK